MVVLLKPFSELCLFVVHPSAAVPGFQLSISASGLTALSTNTL